MNTNTAFSRGTCSKLTSIGETCWFAWGGRVRVNLPDQLTVTDNGCKYEIHVSLLDGRLVATQVKMVADPELTTDMIRGLSAAKWISEAAPAWVQFEDSDQRQILELGFNSGGMTDAALDTFAQHYAYLMVTGQRPSGVFLRDYEMSRPTVTRWLNAARDRGFLLDWHVRRRPGTPKSVVPSGRS